MGSFGRGLTAVGAPATCALALALTGCGEDGKEAAKTTGTLRITVRDLSPGRARYTAPRTVRAGLLRIVLENEGTEPRKAQLFRIQGRHSIAEARRARRPFPRWLYAEGGVGITKPGRSDSVIQRLEPGSYYVSGTYGEKGRVAPLRVTGGPSEAGLPDTPGSIAMNEYSFETSGLKAGVSTVQLTNEGFEPHHAFVAPVQRGHSIAELRRYLKGTKTIPVGEIVDMDKAQESSLLEQGQSQVFRLRLDPGKYGLLCFVPDRKGGPSHVVKGMVDELTVR